MKSRAGHGKSKSKLGYCFRAGEELSEAVKRIVAEQLTRALEVLSRPGDSLATVVHEARRCLKRARSVLRLVKFAIPNAYREENARLRDVGRSLSELRDSHAPIQTLEDLEGRRKNRQPNGSRQRVFREAHTFLENRSRQIAKAMDECGMNNSIAQFKAALSHIQRLSFAKVDGPGIRKSLYRSVKRGRKAFDVAQAEDHADNFHEWRKRAKDLRYQLSLFAELHPDLKQYSKSAKKLEQLLGDDHNLAVLTGLLTESQDPDGEPHFLRKQICERQSALRKKARKIGRHLYGEKRNVWMDRFAAITAES
jgi:CHAD domain-containing protein